MLKKFKKMYYSSIIISFLLLIFGIFLCTKTIATISFISYIIATIIIMNGLFSVVKYIQDKKEGIIKFELAYGIINIIVGLLIILNPTAIGTLLPIIIGVWMVINSTLKIQYIINFSKYKDKNWYISLIIIILMFMFGVSLIFDPFKGLIKITQVIGIVLIIYSILNIIQILNIRKIFKKNLENIDKILK